MTPLVYNDAIYTRDSGDGPERKYMAYIAPTHRPGSGQWQPSFAPSRPYYGDEFYSVNELLRTSEFRYSKRASVYATPVSVESVFDFDGEVFEPPLNLVSMGKVMMVLPLSERETLYVGVNGIALLRDGDVAWMSKKVWEGARTGWFFPWVVAVKGRTAHFGYLRTVSDSAGEANIFSLSLDNPPSNWPVEAEWVTVPIAASTPINVAIVMASVVQDIDFGVASDIVNSADGVMGPDNTYPIANLYKDGEKSVAMFYDMAIVEGEYAPVLNARGAVVGPDGLTGSATVMQLLPAEPGAAHPEPPELDGYSLLIRHQPIVVWSYTLQWNWFWTSLVRTAEEPAATGAPAPIPFPPPPELQDGEYLLRSGHTGDGDDGYYKEYGGELIPATIMFQGKSLEIFALTWNAGSGSLYLGLSYAGGKFPTDIATATLRMASGKVFTLPVSPNDQWQEGYGIALLENVTTHPWPIGQDYGFDLELHAASSAVALTLVSRDVGDGDEGFWMDYGGEVIPGTFTVDGWVLSVGAMAWNGGSQSIEFQLLCDDGIQFPLSTFPEATLRMAHSGDTYTVALELVDRINMARGSVHNVLTHPWPIGNDYEFTVELPVVGT